MEKIRVVLPQKYDLVVGDTFQLFFRGVVEAPNPFCYDILAIPYEEKPVNVRSKTTERFGTNGVHPTLEGYMQIADAMFRNMVSYLKDQRYPQ